MSKNTVDLKYVVDSTQLKKANAEILKTGSNAKKSASVFEQSFRKVELENKKALSSVRKKMAFSKRMEAQKAKEVKVTKQAADQEAKALERLRQKYDQGHVAMEIYSRELNDLGTAFKSNIITKGQYTKELERLNTATKMGTVVSSEFGSVVGQVGRRMSRTGVLFQQSGYQIGDFIVQVQSGQNAMVAFGQQATQMAGTLTMLGGRWLAIGTGLGIVIPLITAAGAAFLRTRKQAEDAAEGVSNFESRIKSLTESLREYSRVKNLQLKGITGEEETTALNLQKAKNALILLQEELNSLETDRVFILVNDQKLEIETLDVKKKNFAIEKKRVEVAQAAHLVSLLESKNAAIRGVILRGESQQIQDKVNLLLIANEYGEDSVEHLKEESRQRTISYAQQVEQYNLSEKQKQFLIRQFEEYQKTVIISKQLAKNQEVLKEGAKSFLSIWESISAKIGEAASKIPASMDDKKYQQLLYYQHYGESRMAAPDDPVVQKNPNIPSGGVGASGANALERLRERIKLDTELLGKTKERQEVERAIANSEKVYGKESVDLVVAKLEAYNKLLEKEQELQGIYDTAQSSMEDGFMAMVEGTKSVEDAFKDMARAIIKDLYEVYVIQRMVGGVGKDGAVGTGIMGGIQKLLSFDGGGYTGSGPRSGGLDGKGGTLAMVHPQETIIDHTKGQSMGGGVTVVQNFNFQANGDESVKKLIAQAAPGIANMAKQGVMADRRRGGSMKATFG